MKAGEGREWAMIGRIRDVLIRGSFLDLPFVALRVEVVEKQLGCAKDSGRGRAVKGWAEALLCGRRGIRKAAARDCRGGESFIVVAWGLFNRGLEIFNNSFQR